MPGNFAVLCSVLGAIFSVGALSDPVENSAAKQESAANCQRFENTQPLCMFTNPEDLAVLPEKKVLIVSEHGGIYGEQPGALVFYDIANQQRRTAFNGGDGFIFGIGHRRDTRTHGLAINVHRTSATNALATAVFTASELGHITQGPQ